MLRKFSFVVLIIFVVKADDVTHGQFDAASHESESAHPTVIESGDKTNGELGPNYDTSDEIGPKFNTGIKDETTENQHEKEEWTTEVTTTTTTDEPEDPTWMSKFISYLSSTPEPVHSSTATQRHPCCGENCTGPCGAHPSCASHCSKYNIQNNNYQGEFKMVVHIHDNSAGSNGTGNGCDDLK